MIFLKTYIVIILFTSINSFSQNDTIIVSANCIKYNKIKKEGTFLEYYIQKRKVKLLQFPNIPKNIALYPIQDSLRGEIKSRYIFKVINTRNKEYIIATTCSEEFDIYKNYNAKNTLLVFGHYNCSYLRNGKWCFYYKQGNVKSEGNYTQGKKTGIWKYYNNKGKLIREVKY